MDVTNLTPAMNALKYMSDLLKDPSKFAELARTFIDPCDPKQPIEICIDDICHQNGEQVSQTLSKGARNFLNNQVRGLMKSPTFLSLFGNPGAVMRAFLEGQREGLCKPENVAEMTVVAQKMSAKTARVSITVDDAARAGALTAGAKLVYDALIFGATICPPARPAAQGLMLLFGITPPGFDYESPTDRMSREGA